MFRVWSTLFNQDMYRKIAENIVIVLIDTDVIMETVNTISIFYSYLFDFVSIFYNISMVDCGC
jgi:hypothetical protein